jgi:Lon protease-like protein
MSEVLDRLGGIRHIPLFPLPLVMLPGELLPLHIFEDRYRKMLKDVESEHHLFGITLFEPGEAIADKPAAGTVGCITEVREVETLPDGRSNILGLGLARYRLIDYVDAGEPYLVGDVQFFEDGDENVKDLEPLADEVFDLFGRMARAAFKMSGSRGTLPEIKRADPEALSFLITAAFNFENGKKYSLLEMTSTTERLRELREILLKTVDQMEETADIQAVSRSNGHSKRKIDL